MTFREVVVVGSIIVSRLERARRRSVVVDVVGHGDESRRREMPYYGLFRAEES